MKILKMVSQQICVVETKIGQKLKIQRPGLAEEFHGNIINGFKPF